MAKPFVFTLMPFDAAFDDIYKLGIKVAVDEAGGYCERVDEQVYEERILDRIYNQIDKADIVVADMTGRNPNVFYEVGYAHGIGKRVILITQTKDDIPFDLQHHFHIIYEGSILKLKKQLNERISWFLSQAETHEVGDGKLTLALNGEPISEGKLFRLKVMPDSERVMFYNYTVRTVFTIRISVKNNSKKLLDKPVKIITETEDRIEIRPLSSPARMFLGNTERYSFKLDAELIYPSDIVQFEIGHLAFGFDEDVPDTQFPMTVRYLSEIGTESYSFFVQPYRHSGKPLVDIGEEENPE